MTFHEGELALQIQAGVQDMAQRIGRGIHPTIPPVAARFLLEQSTAAAASLDGIGRVWASFLVGKPGFVRALNEHLLRIEVLPIAGDPLYDNLAHNQQLGLVVIDFATRQRVRLNGAAELRPDGIYVTIQQAYANCQKYIRARSFHVVERKEASHQHEDSLMPAHQRWITGADTFFIASHHRDGGADASHRGGNAGFVRILDAATLEFPDYAGNMMFNTLGNIAANPRAGLLFLDFARGSTLQLTGQAQVIWDVDRVANFPQAERVIEFHVEHVIEITNAFPFQDAFMPYPSANPPVR